MGLFAANFIRALIRRCGVRCGSAPVFSLHFSPGALGPSRSFFELLPHQLVLQWCLAQGPLSLSRSRRGHHATTVATTRVVRLAV